MKLALVQFSPVFGEVEENLRRIDALCRGIDAQLFVLPELCTTGYQFQDRGELFRLAEPAAGRSAAHLARLAEAKQAYFVFGFAESDDGRIFNSAALVGAGGVCGVYRKSHLFSREKELFHRGDSGFRVFTTPHGRVGIMICFDWIFPEAARCLALQGAQIIAHPANLVLPFCQRAMATRALENRVFTATCNRVGREVRWPDRPLQFTGGSCLMSPTGEALAQAGADTEQVLVAQIDPSQADDKRIVEENDLFADRRPRLYAPLFGRQG